MINDEYILTYFCGKNHKRINKTLLDDIPQEIEEYLNKRYSDSSCIYETIERIKKGIDIHPICPICGKPVKYVGSTRMFLNSCGNYNCSMKININHGKKTNLLKYNVDNPAKAKSVKEKTKKTNIERYGIDYVQGNKFIKEKSKKTNIKKYGNEIPQKNELVKEKIKNSVLNTVKTKYGVTAITKLESVKEKIKNTCLEKYGVSNVFLIDSIMKENITKRFESMKRNHSYGKSKEEDKSYILLNKKYKDIKRQYKSKEYPFACDFYIPSLNLYIECNYSWTHGKHPFNKDNINDINKLNYWKNKNTKYYNNAINTWTIRDVNKRKIAKENNLNYIEFWNIDELKEWLINN